MENTVKTTKEFLSSIMADFTDLDEMTRNIRRCEESIKTMGMLVDYLEGEVDECEISGTLYTDLRVLHEKLEDNLEVLIRGANMIDPDVYEE